jgi:hypothetical protein
MQRGFSLGATPKTQAFGIRISFMISEQSYGAHSALVKMRLIVNGATIRITHMGPDFLLIDSASDYPPGDATIILQVDQSERRWNVRLPDGISRDSKRVTLALCP